MVQPEKYVESILRTFSAADYVVLALLLIICIGIGVYYGFFRGKVTTEDYLIGGRNMKLIPTTLSLIATLISGTLMLGSPADAYLNGNQYVYTSFGYILSSIFMPFAFLPVLHKLQLTSGYQYLEMRFSKSVRLLISALFVIRMIIGIPRFIYPPAVVFNQVTGQSLHYGSALLTIVCIFYTCVGGFKAVVWTDVIQAVFMYGSLILVIVKGTIDIGGPAVVLERSIAGDRLEAPNFDLDPTVRYTFWSLTIGVFCSSLQYNAFYQSMMQRYLSLPKLKTATKAVLITNIGGRVMFAIVCSYLGLLIYATFYDCDPITTKVAKGRDQVVPLFVMKTLGQYPGLPGIFVAGIFSAALSTVSSALNSLSAVALEDFYKTLIKRPITQRESNILMKTVVVVFGIAGGALVYVIEKIGTIVQITYSVGTMTDGPTLGVYVMGFFLPWVNTKGVLAGGISGLSFILWIVLGSQTAISSGRIRHLTKPMSVEGCPSNFRITNTTLVSPLVPNNSDVFIMYRLSSFWNVPMSCLVTVVVGVVVSFLTGANDVTTVDRKLLSPLVRKFFPKPKSTVECVSINGYKPLELQVIAKDMDMDAKAKKRSLRDGAIL